MAAPGEKVGVDGETVLDHAKRIDAATVADAPKLVQEYQVGGSSGGAPEPALAGFIGQLGTALDAIAAKATKLNTTVASNTDALRDAVKTLNAADDQAKSDAQTLQALIDDQPQPKGTAAPASATAAPAGPVAPAAGASAPGDLFQKSASGDRH
ncbi:hypothetical protein [Leifsonia aquatica]|uniref:hypothetical protein n=1 Tax=Leifsonia aquatica TaxID=144185 RepID=UPI000468EE38|nr:hypothetical protein [Leifsonia aquatica]